VIPFNQVSVHMETPVQLGSAAGAPLLARIEAMPES
jgi:hypothetical protein